MSAPRLRLVSTSDTAPVTDEGSTAARRVAAYEFDSFRLLTADKQLLRGGKPVPLRPKLYETLLVLLENPGHLVEKETLLKRLWPDCFVDEAALAQNISKLRKALAGGGRENGYIETVSKRGYRFLAKVNPVGAKSHAESVRITLAVLPFENLSGDAEREYLADGLTEEVIAAVGRIDPEQLRVIGRTSMIAYKRTTKSLVEIGRDVGADFLVESSLRAEGARIRIISRLIRARDQVQIWSTAYDSEPASVLEFQRELSLTIANEVRRQFSPERIDSLAHRQTRQVEAYDLYLRGRYFWNQLSPRTTERAIEFYSRATELDPDYALAWCGLADAYTKNPVNGDADPLQMWPRASEAAERALRCGPDLAATWQSSGMVKFWLGWDWDAAGTALRKAVGLDPSNGLAHRDLAVVLSRTGQHESARVAARRARELEPLYAPYCAFSAQVEFDARDFASAIGFARQAIGLDPEYWVGYMELAQAQAETGEGEAALEALDRAARLSGNSKILSLRGYVLARLGRTQEATAVLQHLEAAARERYVPPYATALVHAGLGDKLKTFDWLDRAYKARDVHLAFLTTDPKWDVYRADPRFRALLSRCGFPERKNERRAN